VASGDLSVEVLEQPDPGMATLVGAGRIAGQFQEVEPVRDAKRPGEVGNEDEACFQRCDEQRLSSLVVAREVAAELAYARPQLLAREVDLAEAGAAA
jgi:hypothetical protein